MEHYRLLSAFVLAILLCKVCKAQECGITKVRSRIVGGTDAANGSWPWIVSVSYYGEHYCGGSIISALWILTAAHCIDPEGFKNHTKIHMGLNTIENLNNTLSYEIDSVWCHPQYNMTMMTNDICLLKLSAPINFTDTIQPVCLAEKGSTFPAGFPSWVVGWGALSEARDNPKILQEVKVPIVGINECRCLMIIFVPDNVICAGYQEGGKSVCWGDSGGPHMVGRGGVWVQLGIVSRGEGCARPNKPAVYELVPAHQDWISEVVGDDYPPAFVQFDPPEEDRDLDYVCQNKSDNYLIYDFQTDSGSTLFSSALLSLCAMALFGVIMV